MINKCLIPYRAVLNSSAIQADMADSLEDEVPDQESMSVGILDYEGLPWRLWNTKYMTLYNAQGKLVGAGMCHSVNSDLVLGMNGPLGDSHIAIHIC